MVIKGIIWIAWLLVGALTLLNGNITRAMYACVWVNLLALIAVWALRL